MESFYTRGLWYILGARLKGDCSLDARIIFALIDEIPRRLRGYFENVQYLNKK